MADLWQAYGSWVLYVIFLLTFIWLHARMHSSGHGCGPGNHDHSRHGHHPDREGAASGPQAARGAQGSVEGPPVQPRGEDAPEKTPRSHSGCC